MFGVCYYQSLNIKQELHHVIAPLIDRLIQNKLFNGLFYSMPYVVIYGKFTRLRM